MKIFNCAIVEDSSIHRIILEKSIHNHPNLQLVCTANNGSEALRKLNKSNIEILFLDISLPGLSGFEVMDKLTIKPQIIIYSSHEENALKAFEYPVTDFLLKPFTENRFKAAVQRAFVKYKLENVAKDEHTVLIKSSINPLEIKLNDIQWVEALGDYVKVITPTKKHVILSTLSNFHKKLPQDIFLRVHKSYIVNSRLIENYNHKYIEIKGHKLPISRTRTSGLDKILNFLE